MPWIHPLGGRQDSLVDDYAEDTALVSLKCLHYLCQETCLSLPVRRSKVLYSKHGFNTTISFSHYSIT